MAARPTTAQEDSDEADAGKGGKADAKAPDVPVETLLAGSFGTGCVLRPGTASGAEERLMAAGPDRVTDTPRSKPAGEIIARRKGAAVPHDSRCRRGRRRLIKNPRLEGRESEHDCGREDQGH